MEMSSAEKDLRVPVATRVTVSQKCALVAKNTNGVMVDQWLTQWPWGHCTEHGQQGREVLPTLLCAGESPCQALGPVLGSPVQGRLGTAGRGPWEAQSWWGPRVPPDVDRLRVHGERKPMEPEMKERWPGGCVDELLEVQQQKKRENVFCCWKR